MRTEILLVRRDVAIEGFWIGVFIGVLAGGMGVFLLTACAQPHRFDPLRQQQLQQQQDACLARGASPKECRP